MDHFICKKRKNIAMGVKGLVSSFRREINHWLGFLGCYKCKDEHG